MLTKHSTSGPQPRARLVLRHYLDPRPAADSLARPIADSVNIPLNELPWRTHELPPRTRVVRVADSAELAREACAWLVAGGRRAEAADRFEFGAPRPDEVGRLWSPTEFLDLEVGRAADKLHADGLAGGGRALDLACGTGRDAVFLAGLGWVVTAIDVLPDALVRGRALAGRCAAAIRPITWIERDLAGDPAGLVEEFTSAGMRFDLITMFRYLHRPLLAAVRGLLNAGGLVLLETFTIAHRARYGRPACDQDVLRPGEGAELLRAAGLEVLSQSEAWREGAHTARLRARRAPG